MTSIEGEIAVLLDTVGPISAGLAAGLLEEAGIPSTTGGPDFDIAELGTAAHSFTRGVTVLVPKTAFDKARALLDEAWGAGAAEAPAE